MEFLYQEAFATDEELLQKICKESVGVVLMSYQKKCRSCGANLVTRGDRSRKLQSLLEHYHLCISAKYVQKVAATLHSIMDTIH